KSGVESYQWPYFLPDGNHFIYRGTDRQASLRSLEDDIVKRLGGGANAQYANNHLIFVRGTSLVAQPFDLSRLELSGEAEQIADQLRVGTAANPAGLFSVSQTGVLVYETGSTLSQFTWFDRTGVSTGVIGDPATYSTMALSPDGNKLVYGRRETG